MLKNVAPSWIAVRSYLVDTPDSRTIISNNKTHQTLLLEGVSSDLYAYLAADGTDLAGFAKQKDIEQTLPAFLEELRHRKLLAFDTDIDDGKSEPMRAPMGGGIGREGDKNIPPSIETRMADWCYAHGFLWSLFMEMTYKCNLKCIHCYNPECDFKSQIRLKDAKRIIDEAVSIGVFNLTISGGECTLSDDFLDILRYAKTKRLNVDIFTNGQFLHDNPAMLDEIISLYPYRVGISIYSANAPVHDKVTSVRGSFEKSIAVLQRLKEAGINTEVKSVQLAESVETWRETLALARKYCASATFDVTLTPTIEGNKKTWKHSVSDEMLMELYTNPDSPMYLGDIKEDPPIPKETDGPCFSGIRTLLVNPSLQVHGCVSLPIRFGDLRKQSFADIWHEAVKDKRGKLYEWQNVKLSEFKNCFHKEHCKFCHFCAGMGMLENKLFAQSSELCRIAKVKWAAFKKLKGAKNVL